MSNLHKSFRFSIFVFLSFVICSAPKKAHAMDESKLPTQFAAEALPNFLASPLLDLKAQDGVAIRYRVFASRNSKKKGVIVISNGRTEFMQKYAEIIYDLRDSGFAVVVYDHRGQGESDRLLEDRVKGYVAKASDYVSDLKMVVDQVAVPMQVPVFLLANSMGGAIATEYLIENPNVVSAFVAVSPMFAPALKGVPQEIAFAIFEGLCLFNGRDYVLGQSYDPLASQFDGNRVTSSLNRFNFAEDLLRANPALEIGGPTNQWTLEAIRMGLDIKARAAELLTPTLIFQAGREEIVLPEAQDYVQSKAKSAEVIKIDDALHEIMMERAELREPVMAKILDFFASHQKQIDFD